MIFYNLLNIICSPLIFVYVAYRVLKGKEDKSRIFERFGIASQERPEGKLIWIHATSVGEVASVLPVISLIKDKNILLTSSTMGSVKFLKSYILPKNVIHQYCPIESYFCIKAFVDYWRPDLVIFTESEFWPGILYRAAKAAKVISINTSISDKTFDRWNKCKSFCKKVLKNITWFLPQSKKDLEKLHELGFNNAEYLGNLKYGASELPYSVEQYDDLKRAIGDRKVVLFASTHPGEEEAVTGIYDALKDESVLFIIAPRHYTRSASIQELLKPYRVVVRSSGDSITKDTQIYLADTIGELGLFYRLSPIMVMGGTFSSIGGHNIIEPAKLGSVVVVGPHVHNIRELMTDFTEAKALLQVSNEDECVEVLQELLHNKKMLKSYQDNACALVEHKKGILEAVIKIVKKYV